MVRANKRNEALRIESALLNKIAMLGTEKTAEAVGVDKSQISRWKGHAKQVDAAYAKECALEGMAKTQVMWLKEGIIKA